MGITLSPEAQPRGTFAAMRLAPLFALLLPACSATVIPANAPADAGADARATPDAPVSQDVPAAEDLPAPSLDVPAPQTDTPTPRADVQGPPMDLVGRWRIVRYQFQRMDGAAVTLTDTPSLYTDPMTGNSAMVRTNGVLNLTPSRFALTLSALAGDHIYSTGAGPMGDTLSVTGFAVPGLLDDRAGRFDVTGGQAQYTLRATGPDAVQLTFSGGSGVVDLARATTAPALDRINALGGVERLRPAQQRPMAHPRAALFWVRPGVRGLTETHGVALQFVGNWAQFPLVIADAPEPGVRFVLQGVELAAAMILVYDDVDDDRRMNLGNGDSLRGMSSVTLVWRTEAMRPPDPGFARSAFADIQFGYQFAWRTRDFSTGGVALIPFDNTRPISPDVPVSPTEIDPLSLESTWR